jgi:hypothetical protein
LPNKGRPGEYIGKPRAIEGAGLANIERYYSLAAAASCAALLGTPCKKRPMRVSLTTSLKSGPMRDGRKGDAVMLQCFYREHPNRRRSVKPEAGKKKIRRVFDIAVNPNCMVAIIGL